MMKSITMNLRTNPVFWDVLRQKVVPMRRSGMEVTMVKPTSMDSSKDICNYLLSGKAVVLNMERNPHGGSTEDH